MSTDVIKSQPYQEPVVNQHTKKKYDVTDDGEMTRIASRLIGKVSTFSHLAECRFVFVFRHGKWESKGDPVFGQVKIVNEIDNAIMDFEAGVENVDVCIIMNYDVWQDAQPKEREAIMDHQLSHIDRDTTENGVRWSTRKHDVEEFVGTLRRHGTTWSARLQVMEKALKEHLQARLPGLDRTADGDR